MVRSKGSAERISIDSESGGEALHLDADQVDSIGQTLGVQLARIVRHERFPILVGFADQLNRSVLQAQSGGIGDGKTQFPGIALRSRGRTHNSTARISTFFILAGVRKLFRLQSV